MYLRECEMQKYLSIQNLKQTVELIKSSSCRGNAKSGHIIRAMHEEDTFCYFKSLINFLTTYKGVVLQGHIDK